MKKPEANGRRVVGVSPMMVSDKRYEEKCPLLWEHLTALQWDDGTSRQTSSILIFTGDGMFKAMLRDREAGLCLWVAADGLEKLFTVLEKSLADPQAEWRVDRQAEGQAASRTKRK